MFAILSEMITNMNNTKQTFGFLRKKHCRVFTHVFALSLIVETFLDLTEQTKISCLFLYNERNHNKQSHIPHGSPLLDSSTHNE